MATQFIQGFIAHNGTDADDAIRYFIARENAEAFGKTAPAMIPVGARVADMFDSLEDYLAEQPHTVTVLDVTEDDIRAAEEAMWNADPSVPDSEKFHFPTCRECGAENVEDAGDHADQMGHWPR
jgi:hypothetical protein